MDATTREDFLWLISDDARSLLRQAQDDFLQSINPVRIAKTLRKSTTVSRSAMLMEQAQLRIRGQAKFTRADEMFFTRRGLEQSTAEDIARYKAAKFEGLPNVADVCCGIGGDLMSLVGRGEAQTTVGIDQDELTCLFAKHNAELVTHGQNASRIETSTFESFDFGSFDAIHCDPDRRMEQRTVVGAHFSPPLNEVLARFGSGQNLAVKAAPATRLRQEGDGAIDLDEVQQEWIGDRRECKQLVIWRGPQVARAGFRTATYVDGAAVYQLSVPDIERDQTVEAVNQLRRFLFEPHPTVIAANLVDVLAHRQGIFRMSVGVDYLTAAEPDKNPLLTQFEILRGLPLDFKTTVKVLKEMDVGEVELKKRGVTKAVFEQFEKMKLNGTNKVTVILTRIGRQHVVAIARRTKR